MHVQLVEIPGSLLAIPETQEAPVCYTMLPRHNLVLVLSWGITIMGSEGRRDNVMPGKQ